MKFGDRLRELLELNNLSQKQLGEKLNIAPSTIGNYVRNIREPDHATLVVFADYFSVTVDFLLGKSRENNLSDDEQLLITVYKNLNSDYKKILLEEGKLLFELQKKITLSFCTPIISPETKKSRRKKDGILYFT